MNDNDILELGTGLPFKDVVLLDDYNPTIEVDWYFIRMVITRLRCLEQYAPEHLAEANIPDTLNIIKKLKEKI